MSVLDGAFIGSSTYLDGLSGGNAVVNANTINVQDRSPLKVSSAIGAYNVGYSGQSGNLTVNTRTLAIRNGGLVETSSISDGKAGNLVINASESIAVSGYGSSDAYESTISSSVSRPTPIYRQLFGLPEIPYASGGNVLINTPFLVISEGGNVNVSNYGVGSAGTLNINAEKIQLKNDALIGAFTFSGDGGNIAIQSNQIVMINNSKIAATAFGNENTGNGGNINIDAGVIVGVNNSDILANASKGHGGNINITTQGIFGLKYRPQQTSGNDINASSEFGVNGTVDILTPGIDPSSGLVELPVELTDQSQQIAAGCSQTNASSFVATGRGGIPQNPTEEIRSNHPWSDIRDLSAYRKSGQVKVEIPAPSETLVQATGWHRRADGKIELFAAQSPTVVQQPLTCAAVPKT